MNTKEARKLAREAAPTCSASDGASDRYRVWLNNPVRVIKARTKKELIAKLLQE